MNDDFIADRYLKEAAELINATKTEVSSPSFASHEEYLAWFTAQIEGAEIESIIISDNVGIYK